MDQVLDPKDKSDKKDHNDKASSGPPTNRPEPKDGSLRKHKDGERDTIRKRERKALMKSLTLAQMSTASMGKFDKKATKAEPAAPTSMVIKKKKSNKQLHTLETDRSAEKNRAMKILGQMQKEKDYAKAGLDKSKAATDDKKMAKTYQKKSDKFKSRVGK